MSEFASSFENTSEEHDFRAYFDRVFHALLVGMALSVIILGTQIFRFGMQPYNGLQLVLMLFFLTTLGLRNHIPLKLVIMVAQSILFLALIIGIARLGLGAPAFNLLLVIPFCIVAVVSFSAAVISLGVIACSLLFIGILYSTGAFVEASDIASQNTNFANWAVSTAMLGLGGFVVIYVTHRLRSYWRESMAELRSQHELVNAMIEYAPEAIMIFDLDRNTIIKANSRASDLFGYAGDGLVNGPSLDDLFLAPLLLSGRAAGCVPFSNDRYLQEALSGKLPHFEARFCPQEGPAIPCDVTLNWLPPKDKRLIRVTITDIRNRKRAEKRRKLLELRLAKAQKLETMGRISGGVAHDFNNSLAAIQGNVELLRHDLTTPEQHEMVDTILQSVKRGSDLTHNMLSFARRAHLSPEVIDLNDLTEDCLEEFRGQLPAGVNMTMMPGKNLWKVRADQHALHTALENLVENAIEAMPDGGFITLQTENKMITHPLPGVQDTPLSPGRYVVVQIRDQGKGIARAEQPLVFDPFHSSKPKTSGPGLGLSMVLGFVLQSGGGLQLRSEEGQGTAITLLFPAARVEPDQAGSALAQ